MFSFFFLSSTIQLVNFAGVIGYDLAANLAVEAADGEMVGDKIVRSASDLNRLPGVFYAAIAEYDVKKHPPEATAYAETRAKLTKQAAPTIAYKLDIIKGGEHYGMAIEGISRALDLIYPRERWQVMFRLKFLGQENPAAALRQHYQGLSDRYGFTIYPLETNYHNLNNIMSSAKWLFRRKRRGQAIDMLNLGVEYFPKSAGIRQMLARYNAADKS